ncbi:MAG: DUF4199 domain-containing protein [Candidatus Cyclobacteriaceae bacterium M3_2C_046]
MSQTTSSGKPDPMLLVPLKYGAMGGFLAFVAVLVFYFIGESPILIARFLDLLILPIFLFFSLKEYRDYYNEKQLHFFQGIAVGFVTFVTLAAVSAIFLFIFLEFIDPGVLQGYIDERLTQLDQNKASYLEKMSEEVYQSTYESVRNARSYNLALDDFIKKSIIGLFATALIAVILRKVPSYNLK